jgi:hypothetical protein
MREGIVRYEPQYMTVVGGRSYCYRNPDSAMRQSRRSTTNPGVTTFDDGTGGSLYLANGDCWIDCSGRQGQHHYGRLGRYIKLVEAV